MSGLFRRRPRPAPVPIPPSPREGPGQHPELRPPPAPPPAPVPPPKGIEEAMATIQVTGKRAPPTSWQDVVNALLDDGYRVLACPGMCRRKGDHAHMRHDAASTDVIVSPAAVERSGA